MSGTRNRPVSPVHVVPVLTGSNILCGLGVVFLVTANHLMCSWLSIDAGISCPWEAWFGNVSTGSCHVAEPGPNGLSGDWACGHHLRGTSDTFSSGRPMVRAPEAQESELLFPWSPWQALAYSDLWEFCSSGDEKPRWPFSVVKGKEWRFSWCVYYFLLDHLPLGLVRNWRWISPKCLEMIIQSRLPFLHVLKVHYGKMWCVLGMKSWKSGEARELAEWPESEQQSSVEPWALHSPSWGGANRQPLILHTHCSVQWQTALYCGYHTLFFRTFRIKNPLTLNTTYVTFLYIFYEAMKECCWFWYKSTQ